ncbi:UNVERIFIED_ORG: hypothetical protein M2438_004127 [Methylobacterium sp. SuP10 SLI 274]|nr:hypothetical protein [Methylorubrum extorquens]MDH6638952.1 hypothetical protein [Methylobacterium sp. SuP10 SLI 274]MDH6668140.1 hypothetical protein [Methylorubrum zatmanii]
MPADARRRIRTAAGFFPARASSRKVVAGFRKEMMQNKS